MAFCLPKEFANKFLESLKSGEIVPEKLMEMSSEKRREFFEDIVGKENAREVNAQFEAKLLLKDQKRGLVTWAKQLTGITEQTRRDLLSKIERMDKVLTAENERAFLNDLANKKLGTEVTFEEATQISKMAKEVVEARDTIPADSPIRSAERLEYGTRAVLFEEYVNGLKGRTGVLGMPFSEWIKKPSAIFETLAGTTKSLVASLDNSFVGRQGIKMLYTHPDIWVKNFLKTWGDIGKELVGKDAIIPIKADIFSRPNALNRKYKVGKYDLDILSEEAFPSSIPGKVPVLGRLYRASESAYNGAALRMRADYADYLINKAEKFGIDTLNPKQAEGIGRLANSTTGRGAVKLTEGQSKFVNVAMFSARFLKSNFDTLTAHSFDKKATAFTRREAAINLTKIIASTATILYISEQLWPGSVDWDPRSSNFGKIKIGDTRFDITGGMGSMVVVASRVVPTYHNGKWSMWYKSSTSGRYTDLLAGKYGQMGPLDVLENYIEGKASPLAGVIRDILKGEHFGGEEVTPESVARQLVTPISIDTFMDTQKNPNAAPLLATMILEGLGISATTY